ncbi:MAG: hypothetical protein WD875_05050 [Pirellulales bacterium]
MPVMPAAPLDVDAPPVRMADDALRPTLELLARVLAGACLGGLVVVAAVVLARRAAGAVAVPLPAAPLLCSGALLASLAALAQWPHLAYLARRTDRRIHVVDVLGLGAPLLAASMLAAAMTLPGTPAGRAMLLWLPLVASQGAIVWLRRARVGVAHQSTVASDDPPTAAMQTDLDAVRDDAAMPLVPVSSESIDEELAPDVTQHWTRRLVDASDVLEGLARAPFASGSRVTNLHVGVCPPFAAAPEVFAETTDGPLATVKVAEALPFGLRLEVRLAESAADDCNVVVAVVARCDAQIDNDPRP